MTTIILLAASSILFMWIALADRRDLSKRDAFYRMDRTAVRKDYKENTVAYSLQTAVTVYFIFWGFTFGYANIIFILTWMAGLYAFQTQVPRLIPLLRTSNTYIELISNNSKVLRIASIALNLGVIIGLIYSELFFASNYFGAVLAQAQSGNAYAIYFWVVFAFLISCALIYVSQGGVEKVIRTDYYQLAIAYLSFSALFAVLLQYIAARNRNYALFLSVGCAAVMTAIGGNPIRRLSSQSYKSLPEGAAYASAIVILISGAYSYLTTVDIQIDTIEIPGLLSMLSAPSGWAPIISFSLANILWQFSDYTAYQRLTVLGNNTTDDSIYAQELRQSIRSTMFASPLTWTLGILIGIALRASNLIDSNSQDVFGSFVDLLTHAQNTTSSLGLVAQAAFGLHIVGVMYSTVDSAVLAALQIVEEDTLRKTKPKAFRLIILCCLGGLVLCFAILHLALQVDILAKLSFVYSMGLVFAGVFIAHMLGRPIRPIIATGILLVSVSAGFYALVWDKNLPPLISIVLPQFVALSSSLILFGIAYFVPGLHEKQK